MPAIDAQKIRELLARRKYRPRGDADAHAQGAAMNIERVDRRRAFDP
jgi:hypothetical protein